MGSVINFKKLKSVRDEGYLYLVFHKLLPQLHFCILANFGDKKTIFNLF